MRHQCVDVRTDAQLTNKAVILFGDYTGPCEYGGELGMHSTLGFVDELRNY
jgi:hypothetical protein